MRRHLIQSGERFVGHVAAIVVGLVLMIIGIGMGVTIVLVPLAIPVGIAGLVLFMGGMTTHARRRRDEAIDVDSK
jgi:hypothetical protein